MRKMLVLTPEQWARLQRGSQQLVKSENKREKQLSDYVNKLDLKELPKKPEKFDRFQTLFHRFISDQKRARAPLTMELKHENDEWVDEDFDDTDSPGGSSFVYNDRSASKSPSRKKTAAAAAAGAAAATSDPGGYKSFVRNRANRKSVVSTPRPKRKRRGPEVTPDLSLVKKRPKRSLRSGVTWESVKM